MSEDEENDVDIKRDEGVRKSLEGLIDKYRELYGVCPPAHLTMSDIYEAIRVKGVRPYKL